VAVQTALRFRRLWLLHSAVSGWRAALVVLREERLQEQWVAVEMVREQQVRVLVLYLVISLSKMVKQ
jgi:hypothetical protein